MAPIVDNRLVSKDGERYSTKSPDEWLRYSTLQRGLRLVLFLCSGWRTTKEIERELGIKRRTITRMMRVIEAELPLERHTEYLGIEGTYVMYRIEPGWAKRLLPPEVAEFWRLTEERKRT